MSRQHVSFAVIGMVVLALGFPTGYASEPASHGKAPAQPAAAEHGQKPVSHPPAANQPEAKSEPPAAPSGHGQDAPSVTADQALQLMKEGNARFLADKLQNPNTDARRRADTAANGQKPVVTIISCSDSRVPVELIFDRGIGELFIIRVAGNVCDTDEIGSAEYGVDHLGTPLLLVLGHTRCGAVTAVASGAELHGHIAALVENIKPAVQAARKAHPDLAGEAIVPQAIQANVLQSIKDLLTASPVIRERVQTGKVRIEGAIYDIAEGKIEWLGPHPEQPELLKLAEDSKPAGHAPATSTRPSDSHATADPAPAAQPHPPTATTAMIEALAESARGEQARHQPVPNVAAPAGQPSGIVANQPAAHPAPPSDPKPSTADLPSLLERCMAEELYRQGVQHLETGQYAQAAGRFQAAAELDPSMLAARNDLAGVYCLQQKYSEALTIYKSILAVDAQYRHALRGAALCHASLRQYDQGQAMLQKLLGLDRGDARTWLELGDVSFLGGDVDAAKQYWRSAAQVDRSATETIKQANLRLKVYSTKDPGPTAQAR